jgi:hypothetical protein
VLNVVAVSPNNEMPVVERLAAGIRKRWPELEQRPEDRIDLLVGIRSGTEVDLVIAIDLATPYQFGPGPNERVECALIAVEIKQLDPEKIQIVGNQMLARYDRKSTRERSVGEQARDAARGIKAIAETSGFPGTFVYAIAWLTEIDDDDLRGIDPIIVGRNTNWRSLLRAAFQQRPLVPFGTADAGNARAGVRAVRDRLLNRRQPSSLDRIKLDRIANHVAAREIVDAIAPRAGNAFIRLSGRGGSGKTTALALLANRLATVYSGRVLVLTFHHALRGDIHHALSMMPDAQLVLGDRLHVDTATSFLMGVANEVIGSLPLLPAGTVDYARLDEAYATAAQMLTDGPDGELAASLRAIDPARFDWDHVLIDEAQDWTDEARDLLHAVYGPRRIAIADGLEQLILRQTPCNWMAGLARADIEQRVLGDSLRMQRNIARFANAFAQACEFPDWYVKPRDDMPGGRVIIVTGDIVDYVGVAKAAEDVAKIGKADPLDCLICVSRNTVSTDAQGGRRSAFAEAITGAGGTCWDAVNLEQRRIAPQSPDAWRVVNYDSCRGLEGWVTLALDLDQLYAAKLRHPNYHRDDAHDDSAVVARRWLLIPMTRAVHLLVISIHDMTSPVVGLLRDATDSLPKGFVEWCEPHEVAARIG